MLLQDRKIDKPFHTGKFILFKCLFPVCIIIIIVKYQLVSPNQLINHFGFLYGCKVCVI